jgi:hypothetical protein
VEDLSKKRDMFADLAPILWHSFGVIPALLQEIVSIYPLLSPPSLTNHASNRVCNALALLQCVASHPDTRAGGVLRASTRAMLNFILLLRPSYEEEEEEEEEEKEEEEESGEKEKGGEEEDEHLP